MYAVHIYQYDKHSPMSIGHIEDVFTTDTRRNAEAWLDREVTARFGPTWEWINESHMEAGFPMQLSISQGWARLAWIDEVKS